MRPSPFQKLQTAPGLRPSPLQLIQTAPGLRPSPLQLIQPAPRTPPAATACAPQAATASHASSSLFSPDTLGWMYCTISATACAPQAATASRASSSLFSPDTLGWMYCTISATATCCCRCSHCSRPRSSSSLHCWPTCSQVGRQLGRQAGRQGGVWVNGVSRAGFGSMG